MCWPPQQALIVERMHSGARRFVILDFGSPVLLTDLMIPSCSDLVSLSIDIWTKSEEADGTRLIVAGDIGSKPLIICDLQPPPVCRYLKVKCIIYYSRMRDNRFVFISVYLLSWLFISFYFHKVKIAI